ncbi:MAG TPA: response regulator transcription factor [Solimonas sp.]|nr:response regulator transcription factor [Solimonas sp.]
MPAPTSPAPVPLLVVEDNKDLSDILMHVLRRAGFDVQLARTGREAELAITEGAPPALALMDIGLPYKDGFQLIQLIRATPAWQQVPIVMLSGRNRREDIERARALGADDYLIKPFQPAELLSCIRRRLAARSVPS